MDEFGTAEHHALSGLQLARTYGNRLREGRLLLQLAKISAAGGGMARATGLLTESIAAVHGISPKLEREATALRDVLSATSSYTYPIT